MSVLNRIKDAEMLLNAGRLEGALLSLLVAVAATARRRYPKQTRSHRDPSRPMGDRESFTQFLSDEMRVLTENPMFRTERFQLHVAGKEGLLQNILYDYFRNTLVHEARTSPEVEILPGTEFRLDFQPDRLRLSCWIHRGLFRVLVTVPENQDELREVDVLQFEMVELMGSKWLAWDSWRKGGLRSELGLPVFRPPFDWKAEYAKLANDPEIKLVPKVPNGKQPAGEATST